MFKKYFKLKNIYEVFGKIVILDLIVKSLDHHLNLLNFIMKTTNIGPELLSPVG